MIGPASLVAAAVAMGMAGFAITKGTWAVGGSDSSCYALMADAFARGELQPATSLAREAPWPLAAQTFAPAGFIPSPVRGAAASPICAPGFSLFLAPFRVIGGRDSIFLLTPLAGALLVWLSFVFGKQLAGSAAGIAAATVVATMPIVLFQVTQPMNDITVAAVWMAVLVSASAPDPSRPWLLGALTGLAILVRPNLAPAGAVVFLWVVTMAWRDNPGPAPPARRRMVWRNVLAFAIACAPPILVMLALNVGLYGHPLQSGYGRADDLFSAEHVLPNLRNYGAALMETQLGVPLLGVAALFTVPRFLRPVVWLTLLISVAVASVYLPYQTFNEWWYLRFFLPALVPLTALAAVAGARVTLGRGRRNVSRLMVGAVIVAAIAWFGVVTARNRQAFDIQTLEGRFRRSGSVARDLLPAHAVFVTVWHSGTVRFHADRLSVLWDSLDPRALDEALAWLSSRGLEPYLVVERWEEPLFQERFAAHTPIGNLDWPPRFDIDRTVRIFNVADRVAYLEGKNIPTQYVWP